MYKANLKRVYKVKKSMIMNNLKDFDSYKLNEYSESDIEVKFTNTRNQAMNFSVFKTRDGRITKIGQTRIRFPFSVGQVMNRSIETWACNNNFLIDGKDPCPEKKIFGVKVKDVPQGHEWRRVFPNKFR